MKITTEPRSDQWNADDFIGGGRTFTIAGVKIGAAEQKYDIELVEGEGRSWRPPVTVLRLLVAGWGDDATVWRGRRVRLYRDPEISFGRDKVGGIRLSHMSDLPDGKPLRIMLTESRGKRAPYVVEPLPATSTEPTPDELAAQVAAALADATTEAEVREWGNRANGRNLLDITPPGASETLREMVQSRLAALQATPADAAQDAPR